MSTTLHKTSKPNQQSLFFRDLASPISTHRGSAGGGAARFATPGQAAAVSALWRENFNSSDPPPPPMFTLEDRADFSPEPGLGELPASPELGSDPKTPTPTRGYFSSPSPLKVRAEASGSGVGNTGFGVSQQQQVQQQTPGSSSWWSPARSEEKGKGSPVDGVVQSQALIMLPPPREVVRPEAKRDNLPVGGGLDEEEWVTVYGFSPGDTNLVLREFEKCGVILKHVPGPRDANWMHILYQNRYDARKALAKNGVQLNGVLIIGVKPVDPVQLQYLNERPDSSTHGGFMVSLPPQSKAGRSAALNPMAASQRPNHLQNGSTISSDSGRRSTGAIATPAKSVVSKVMDLMFGL